MDPKEVLSNHLELCNGVYKVLLEENTWLKTKKSSPSNEILDRKKEMLPMLENSLQNLIDARMLHLGEDRETATKAAIAYLSVLGRLTA